jgi:MFS family permease
MYPLLTSISLSLLTWFIHLGTAADILAFANWLHFQQIIQGIAPSFVGNLSDETGRRPALLFSLIIYIAGCVGAAIKANYALLLVMRCLQSAGSSGAIALSLATVSDIVTSAERGRYTSNVQLGWMLGPSLGPVSVLALGSQSCVCVSAYRNFVWVIRSLGAYLANTSAGDLSSGFSPSML